MTTHDEQTTSTSTVSAADDPSSATQSTRTEPTESPNEPLTAEAEPSADEPPADEPLFADGTLSGLRSRWDDVQAAFVDDPKECVQRADALVAQVIEELTTGFSQARSRLETQWAQGKEASTEDLRVALKRYREFFQRLLEA